ncbi:JmjC domain-containing histone demethylation protein 1 [Umbelopsis nana]
MVQAHVGSRPRELSSMLKLTLSIGTEDKPALRKSDRQHTKLNYADMNEGLTGDEKIWEKIINSKQFTADPFKRYRGDQVSLDMIRQNGLTEPIVFPDPAGLDLTMPPSDITVRDIADLVGGDTPVDVIDVATQAEQPGWTMKKWAEYFHSQERDRIRNVISLEISGTKFAEGIRRPKLVRDMDWIDNVWPPDLKVKEYPKVQLYCLMGTKNSYTDFHIDFGGTSVFYHIISGAKIFYFIPPTPTNLRKYEKWSSSPDQPTIFLGDEVKECYKVQITSGNTMIIPSGWIHSVFTPEDSIVIGGNFLQGFAIEQQLNMYDLEDRTNVPQKFRFPYFMRMNWYAAEKYRGIVRDHPERLSRYELEGLRKLAQYLLAETAFLDSKNGTADKRRQVRQDIPSTITAPIELVLELANAVSKVLGAGAVNTQIKDEPTKRSLKVKLKVQPTKEMAKPRLKLKMKEPSIGRSKKEDDDFVYDDSQYFDEEIDEESLAVEDDDDEYVQGDAPGRHKPVKKTPPAPKRKRGEKKPYQDDSSDDGLGTGKVKTKRASNKGVDDAASDKKTKGSVKQRLLNRIRKK